MKTPTLALLKEGLGHPIRMMMAAAMALVAAKVLGLSEVYWAPIAALIVVQSDSNAMLATSWLLLVGTALGASTGALLAAFGGRGMIIFALGILGIGALSAALRLDRRANHFAAMTVVIVLLAGTPDHAWQRALHRFVEFSAGIVIALLLKMLWPEEQVTQAGNQDLSIQQSSPSRSSLAK